MLGGSPGAGILGCGPSCVTWCQSLPLSGPSVFISERQSLACLSWLAMYLYGVHALGGALSWVLKPEWDQRGRAFG